MENVKLIDFKSWCKDNCTRNLYEGIELAINNYEEEKSINKALDETKTVNNNEQTKEVCGCKAPLNFNDWFNAHETQQQVKKLNIDDVSKCLHPFDELENTNNRIKCNKCNEWLTNVC